MAQVIDLDKVKAGTTRAPDSIDKICVSGDTQTGTDSPCLIDHGCPPGAPDGGCTIDYACGTGNDEAPCLLADNGCHH